jgi:hypothetical protein
MVILVNATAIPSIPMNKNQVGQNSVEQRIDINLNKIMVSIPVNLVMFL